MPINSKVSWLWYRCPAAKIIAPIIIDEINPSCVYLNSCPNKNALKNSSSTKPAIIVPAIKLGIEIFRLNSKKNSPPKNSGIENIKAITNGFTGLWERPKFLKIFNLGFNVV